MSKTIDLSNVRRRPAVLDYLPGLSAGSGTTIYPSIYVGRQLYANIHSVEPNPYYLGLIIHEQEHMKRIKARGPVKWYVRYIFRSDFRLSEELAAYAKQFAYLKNLGLTYDLDHCAHNLSSFIYMWSTSENDALLRLQSLWEKA